MKRLTHLVTNIVLISSLVFLLSCSTDDNAARKDDNPVRIGIAWRGDSTAITFVSALQSVRETGAVPVVLPLLKSPFMDYEDALCYFQALVNYRSSKINPCQFSPKTF